MSEEQKLTNEELQEAIKLYDAHHVYIAKGGAAFVIIQCQRKGEKEVFVWQIIQAQAARIAELEKERQELLNRLEHVLNNALNCIKNCRKEEIVDAGH